MLEPNDLLISSIDFQIKIIDCVPYPKELEADIIEWLNHQPTILGVGKHDIFYAYSNDFENEPDLNFVIEISSMSEGQLIYALRKNSGKGIFDCKKALEKFNGNYVMSLDYLKQLDTTTLIDKKHLFEICLIYCEDDDKHQIYRHCLIKYNEEIIYKLDCEHHEDMIGSKHFINGYCVAHGLGTPIVEYKHEIVN